MKEGGDKKKRLCSYRRWATSKASDCSAPFRRTKSTMIAAVQFISIMCLINSSMMNANALESFDNYQQQSQRQQSRSPRDFDRSDTSAPKLEDFQPQNVHLLTMEQMLRAKYQFEEMEKSATEEQKNSQPLHRKLFQWEDVQFWKNGRTNFKPYNVTPYFADSGEEYSPYSTAYRMLGGYIDCDHSKEEGSGDRNGNGYYRTYNQNWDEVSWDDDNPTDYYAQYVQQRYYEAQQQEQQQNNTEYYFEDENDEDGDGYYKYKYYGYYNNVDADENLDGDENERERRHQYDRRKLKSGDNDNSHSGSRDGGSGDNNNSGCTRWMMWAAYVNENYSSAEFNYYEEEEEQQGGNDEHQSGDHESGDEDNNDKNNNNSGDRNSGDNNNKERRRRQARARRHTERERDLAANYQKYANDDNGYYHYRGDDDYSNNKNDGSGSKDGDGGGDDDHIWWYDETYDGSSNRFRKSSSKLDCGEDGSEWKLLGVYRQEFYQFYEQISKHLWVLNDARYITALAGLDYMTDSDCAYVGQDYKGNPLYAGPQPLYAGYFQMAIYTDKYCLELNDSGYTYDDFVKPSCLDLNCDDGQSQDNDDNKKNYYYDDDQVTCEYFFTGGDAYYGGGNNNNNNNNGNKLRLLKSGDGDQCDANDDDVYKSSISKDSYYYRPLSLDYKIWDYEEAKQVWRAAQEYTMYNFNLVYHEYMQCTPCMDYPTFQDGYFNGDSGYYEDDLINQCWKFYSHDSYTCNGDCQYMGLAQGTVNTAIYASNDYVFAERATDVRNAIQSYETRKGEATSVERFIMYDDRDKFLSNTFFFFSFGLWALMALTYHCMGGCRKKLQSDMFREKLLYGDDADSDDDEGSFDDEDSYGYGNVDQYGNLRMDSIDESDASSSGGSDDGHTKTEGFHDGNGWHHTQKGGMRKHSDGIYTTNTPNNYHNHRLPITRRSAASRAPGEYGVFNVNPISPQKSGLSTKSSRSASRSRAGGGHNNNDDDSSHNNSDDDNDDGATFQSDVDDYASTAGASTYTAEDRRSLERDPSYERTGADFVTAKTFASPGRELNALSKDDQKRMSRSLSPRTSSTSKDRRSRWRKNNEKQPSLIEQLQKEATCRSVDDGEGDAASSSSSYVPPPSIVH